MISVILLNDDNKYLFKQDFLIVDLKVDSNIWTPVYVCESLQGQAAKNMHDLFMCVIISFSVKITAWTSKDYVLNCLHKMKIEDFS